MTSKEIRNKKAGSRSELFLREIAATLAEFNERAKVNEPLAMELAKLSLDGMKRLNAEVDKEIEISNRKS